MEFSLSSAFTIGGLVGHFAYLLLILSMIMRRIVLLRILVIASALVAILYAVVWLKDPVSAFWEALLVVVNATQLLITWRQNSRARFTEEELAFVDRRFRGLQRGEQRRLLDYGTWTFVKEGTAFTLEGQAPDSLFFLTEGNASVEVGGRPVAACGPGSYIGEMSLVGGQPASATVRAVNAARVWQISRVQLTEFDRKHPTWLAVIEAGIARDMRDKIVLANTGKLT
ncbi:MAG: cyclic nucleotide-binding domain-containing protein [Pseudomonadota bacterium]